MPRNIGLTRLADAPTLSAAVAQWLLGLARTTEGRFAICLSGGSTPRLLYEHLATSPLCAAFPWARTHLFWGDERFVPGDDPLSNYRMVREALLNHVAIPRENIHPIPTAGTPEEAAQAYERSLKTFYGAERLYAGRPLFDVTFLGLGPDGHTASLFPGTEVLAERQHWVAAVVGAKPEARITLTYPALESSRHVAFLVQGQDKQDILERFWQGDTGLPAARVTPDGALHVFADEVAAARIEGER